MSQQRDETPCGRCARPTPAEDLLTLDGAPVCSDCLFGDSPRLTVRPVGVVHNRRRRADTAFGLAGGGDQSEIHLLPTMAPFLRGVADESHLTVVWYLHAARGIRSVFQRGWDGKEVGPFASRTPDRPTPIAVSEVELLHVEGTVLTVRGFDAIDGTPVLDVKVSMQSLRRTPRRERPEPVGDGKGRRD